MSEKKTPLNPEWQYIVSAEHTKFYQVFLEYANKLPHTGNQPIWEIDDTSLKLLIASAMEKSMEWL